MQWIDVQEPTVASLTQQQQNQVKWIDIPDTISDFTLTGSGSSSQPASVHLTQANPSLDVLSSTVIKTPLVEISGPFYVAASSVRSVSYAPENKVHSVHSVHSGTGGQYFAGGPSAKSEYELVPQKVDVVAVSGVVLGPETNEIIVGDESLSQGSTHYNQLYQQQTGRKSINIPQTNSQQGQVIFILKFHIKSTSNIEFASTFR